MLNLLFSMLERYMAKEEVVKLKFYNHEYALKKVAGGKRLLRRNIASLQLI